MQTPNQPTTPNRFRFRATAPIHPSLEPYREPLLAAAREADVDPTLLSALLFQESSGKGNAQGKPIESRGGERAQGLGMITSTAIDQLRQDGHIDDTFDVKDPVQNLRASALYMRRMLDVNKGDPVKAIASYNWGEGKVARFGLEALQSGPEYEETRRHIKNISNTYRELTSGASATPPVELPAMTTGTKNALAQSEAELQRKRSLGLSGEALYGPESLAAQAEQRLLGKAPIPPGALGGTGSIGKSAVSGQYNPVREGMDPLASASGFVNKLGSVLSGAGGAFMDTPKAPSLSGIMDAVVGMGVPKDTIERTITGANMLSPMAAVTIPGSILAKRGMQSLMSPETQGRAASFQQVGIPTTPELAGRVENTFQGSSLAGDAMTMLANPFSGPARLGMDKLGGMTGVPFQQPPSLGATLLTGVTGMLGAGGEGTDINVRKALATGPARSQGAVGLQQQAGTGVDLGLAALSGTIPAGGLVSKYSTQAAEEGDPWKAGGALAGGAASVITMSPSFEDALGRGLSKMGHAIEDSATHPYSRAMTGPYDASKIANKEAAEWWEKSVQQGAQFLERTHEAFSLNMLNPMNWTRTKFAHHLGGLYTNARQHALQAFKAMRPWDDAAESALFRQAGSVPQIPEGSNLLPVEVVEGKFRGVIDEATRNSTRSGRVKELLESLRRATDTVVDPATGKARKVKAQVTDVDLDPELPMRQAEAAARKRAEEYGQQLADEFEQGTSSFNKMKGSPEEITAKIKEDIKAVYEKEKQAELDAFVPVVVGYRPDIVASYLFNHLEAMRKSGASGIMKTLAEDTLGRNAASVGEAAARKAGVDTLEDVARLLPPEYQPIFENMMGAHYASLAAEEGARLGINITDLFRPAATPEWKAVLSTTLRHLGGGGAALYFFGAPGLLAAAVGSLAIRGSLAMAPRMASAAARTVAGKTLQVLGDALQYTVKTLTPGSQFARDVEVLIDQAKTGTGKGAGRKGATGAAGGAAGGTAAGSPPPGGLTSPAKQLTGEAATPPPTGPGPGTPPPSGAGPAAPVRPQGPAPGGAGAAAAEMAETAPVAPASSTPAPIFSGPTSSLEEIRASGTELGKRLVNEGAGLDARLSALREQVLNPQPTPPPIPRPAPPPTVSAAVAAPELEARLADLRERVMNPKPTPPPPPRPKPPAPPSPAATPYETAAANMAPIATAVTNPKATRALLAKARTELGNIPPALTRAIESGAPEEIYSAMLETADMIARKRSGGYPTADINQRISKEAKFTEKNFPEEARPDAEGTWGMWAPEVNPAQQKAVTQAMADLEGALGVKREPTMPRNSDRRAPGGAPPSGAAERRQPVSAEDRRLPRGYTQDQFRALTPEGQYRAYQIAHQEGNVDQLTQVASQGAFLRAKASGELADRPGVFMDLDNVHEIDKAFGQEGGDAYIRQGSELTLEAARDLGIEVEVFRIGGDEFYTALARGASAEDAARLATEVSSRVEREALEFEIVDKSGNVVKTAVPENVYRGASIGAGGSYEEAAGGLAASKKSKPQRIAGYAERHGADTVSPLYARGGTKPPTVRGGGDAGGAGLGRGSEAGSSTPVGQGSGNGPLEGTPLGNGPGDGQAPLGGGTAPRSGTDLSGTGRVEPEPVRPTATGATETDAAPEGARPGSPPPEGVVLPRTEVVGATEAQTPIFHALRDVKEAPRGATVPSEPVRGTMLDATTNTPITMPVQFVMDPKTEKKLGGWMGHDLPQFMPPGTPLRDPTKKAVQGEITLNNPYVVHTIEDLKEVYAGDLRAALRDAGYDGVIVLDGAWKKIDRKTGEVIEVGRQGHPVGIAFGTPAAAPGGAPPKGPFPGKTRVRVPGDIPETDPGPRGSRRR